MYQTSVHEAAPSLLPASSKVRLTRFDHWWATLMPPAVKRVLPPWQISAGLVTLVAFYTADQLLTTLIMLFWASMSFTWLFSKLQRTLKPFRWVIPAYHAGLYHDPSYQKLAQAQGEKGSDRMLEKLVDTAEAKLLSERTPQQQQAQEIKSFRSVKV